MLLYKLGLILESTVRVMFYVILISALFTVYVLEKEIHKYEGWTIFYRWRDFSTVLCGLMISNLGKLFLVKENCVPIFHFVTVLKKYEKNQ